MMEDIPIEDLNDLTHSTTVKKKSKKLPTECKICGAPALYSYFSTVVCFACKVFFKRNAELKQGHFKCVFDGHCGININNRHICTSCRLIKCFASGMQIEMIRPSRTNKNNTSENRRVSTISTISSAKDQPQQLLPLNLLRSDQSTLSVDQWNLLSNLSHCYDEYSGFLLAEQFIRHQNELPLKMRFKLVSVSEFLTLITSMGQLLYEKNADFTSLCSHDRSILLRNTMMYVSGLGTCFITRYTRLFDYDGLYKSAEIIYGSITLANSSRAINQIDPDGTFVKLILALLTFSTTHYTYYTNNAPDNLTNIKAVLRIQDMYTDLTWRYLVYKYDHQRAVLCFSNLIRCLFSLNDALINAVEHKQYTDMINSLVKETEETYLH